jgi:ribosomal protein S12 methylthiotransferase accessory factor
MFIAQDERPTRKNYVYGTHRFCDPAETLRSISGHFPAMGITRIADITGLDAIGIPVCLAVRPNSKSLSVSQGKGLNPLLAKVSAAMETIELYHAENITLDITLSSYRELARRAQVCDPNKLNLLPNAHYHHDLRLHWVKGFDLIQKTEVFVPYDLVHCSLLPQSIKESLFPVTSNGLASGNHFLEAVSHGICEVIERDAIHLGELKGQTADFKVQYLDLNTVDSLPCRELLDKIKAAGLSTYVWRLATDVEIPAFGCAIVEERGTLSLMSTGIFHGFGCHLSKEIAFTRAVTEAAQTRLTYISGARDDIYREWYTTTQSEFFQAQWKRFMTKGQQTIDFRKLPSLETDSLDADVSIQLSRLQSVGLDQVIVIDLTQPQFRIAVVRVIIPETGLSLHGTVTKLSQRMRDYVLR